MMRLLPAGALPSQAVRRRDVILLFASYPLGTAMLHALLGDSTWYGLSHIVLTVTILATLAIFRVGRADRRIADDIDARLDERQIAQRNAAYLAAYRVVSGVAVLGCIWIALGTDKGWWWIPDSYNEWNDIFWGLFILTTSLPAAILSWREPDRADEHEGALYHA
jgi:hypothetical protein